MLESSVGSIVLIGSIATPISTTAQHISTYVATKAAIRGLVKPLAMKLAPPGTHIKSLSPGHMMTNVMRALQTKQAQLVIHFEKETLFWRIGYPDKVKRGILFLCNQARR